jgi:hypothetical protein
LVKSLTTPSFNWITNTTGVFSPGGAFSNAIPAGNNSSLSFRINAS